MSQNYVSKPNAAIMNNSDNPNEEANLLKQQNNLPSGPAVIGGGRFDFDDGGTYCGGWHDGKAHGHGICTGPKGQGEYAGSWHYGFEVSGVYKWPSGATYEGQWQNGKRHGLGVEYRGKWVYKGEWTQGYKGRYGIRASLLSNARYEGTWANGLQDGYGSETYADSGTYQGQWLRGMRHGYGVRASAPYGHSTITKMANNQNNPGMKHASLQSLDTENEDAAFQQAEHRDAVRGGFVLVARVSPNHQAAASSKRRNSLVEKTQSSSSLTGGFLKGLRLRKQRSTGDLDVRSQRNQKSQSPSLRSSRENSEAKSMGSKEINSSQQELGSNASFLTQDGEISDPSTVETYYGEWKNDKRCGFGICERTDGLRYSGEWYNNKKYGYGVTTFSDGTREEGKYKNNMLVTNIRKKHLFMMRSAKLRERIESAVLAAQRAQQIALQKSDIAASRTATARSKSEQADYSASSAQNDSQMAIIIAKQYGGGDLAGTGPVSVAPLRRRLSDFSQVRRFREGQPMMFDNNLNSPNVQQANRQFLEPNNEPFGGRRGSFRTQMMNQNSSLQMPYHHHQQQHQQHHPFPPQPMHQTQGYGFSPNSPQPNRYLYPQHSQGIRDQSPQTPHHGKDPFSQAFIDHFDHYQRNETPEPSISARYVNSRNQFTSPSSSGFSINYSPTSSPSPPRYPQSITPSISSPSPIPKPPLENNIKMPPKSNFQEIPSMARLKNRMANNVNNMNINYEIDESNNETEGVRHLRTASLYRVPIPQSSGGGGGGGSSGGFKRKPSLQANVSKQINKPIMSREEVSYLSHQQREHRRIEQEYRERLSRNPLLYLWSPNFINWLNRQKLVILVFFINASIAYLFFRMIV